MGEVGEIWLRRLRRTLLPKWKKRETESEKGNAKVSFRETASQERQDAIQNNPAK